MVKVCIPALERCTESDAEGAFSLQDIRAGSYALEITAPNQKPFTSTAVEARAGLEAQVEITLPKLDGISDMVTISERSFIAPEEIENSGYLVQRREISKTAGSLQDVSRYVQTLPGVAIGSNDFRNDIIVRGGSPLENLFVVDNIEIPSINNYANFASAGGVFSILDAELIQDVNFLTGGYPAPYINRLSTVKLERGRALAEFDDQYRREVCVIGADVADALFPAANPIGKTIKLGAFPYEVIGVYAPIGSSLGASQDSFVQVPLNSFAKLFGARSRSIALLARAKPDEQLSGDVLAEDELPESELDDLLRFGMRQVRRLAPGDADNFSLTTAGKIKAFAGSLTRIAAAVLFPYENRAFQRHSRDGGRFVAGA